MEKKVRSDANRSTTILFKEEEEKNIIKLIVLMPSSV